MHTTVYLLCQKYKQFSNYEYIKDHNVWHWHFFQGTQCGYTFKTQHWATVNCQCITNEQHSYNKITIKYIPKIWNMVANIIGLSIGHTEYEPINNN